MEDMSAMNYEFMIRRAFDCGRFKKGADADLFRRLQELELYYNENPGNAKIQKQYQKHLEQVKEYSQNALQKVLKTVSKKKKAGPEQITVLQSMADTLNMALNTREIADVIKGITNSFNELNIGNN